MFIEWPSPGKEDIKAAFTAEGHDVVCFPFALDESKFRSDTEYERALSEVMHKETPDVVFQVNYFPIISRVCNKEKIKYISWTYDSPYLLLYSKTVLNPCNVIFIFDKALYLQLYNAGIRTVHYMPLAVNTERLDQMGPAGTVPFLYDVSFVGSLYLERGNLYDQMVSVLPDYAEGYLDALIAAQLKIQGYNFIEEALGPVIDDLKKAMPIVSSSDDDGMETIEYLYAQYVINKRITAIERIDLLDAAAQNHTVDLFTHYKDFTLPNLRNHGHVQYDSEMPMVFKQSKINLNITLRSIHSGIPLRAFDIMGAGGFLLSNFQTDFEGLFVPGEDYVYYDSKEDFVRKIDYYLKHGDERMAIAKNGYDKVASGHTYRHRIREMLDF